MTDQRPVVTQELPDQAPAFRWQARREPFDGNAEMIGWGRTEDEARDDLDKAERGDPRRPHPEPAKPQ